MSYQKQNFQSGDILLASQLNSMDDEIESLDKNAVRNLSVADDFSTSVSYNIGDYVFYNNQLYKFVSSHSAGAWDSNDVVAVKLVEEMGSGGTSSYSDLSNKPSINAVTLSGNKTSSDLGLQDKINQVTVSTAGSVTQALDTGKFYHFSGILTALTITLNAPTDLPHYHFDFDSGSTAVTLTLPISVVMPAGFSVSINTHYEIDILNNYGVVCAWALS